MWRLTSSLTSSRNDSSDICCLNREQAEDFIREYQEQGGRRRVREYASVPSTRAEESDCRSRGKTPVSTSSLRKVRGVRDSSGLIGRGDFRRSAPAISDPKACLP